MADRVLGPGWEGERVKWHITNIRKKLGECRGIVKTRARFGYRYQEEHEHGQKQW